MNTNQQKNDPWDACPEGELLRMAKRLDARDRRVQIGRLFRTTAASVVLLAAAVLMAGFVGGLVGQGASGISCKECREHFASYNQFLHPASLEPDTSEMESLTKPLTPAMSQSMAEHLAHCEPCRRLFQERFPGALAAGKISQRLPLFATSQAFSAWE